MDIIFNNEKVTAAYKQMLLDTNMEWKVTQIEEHFDVKLIFTAVDGSATYQFPLYTLSFHNWQQDLETQLINMFIRITYLYNHKKEKETK